MKIVLVCLFLSLIFVGVCACGGDSASAVTPTQSASQDMGEITNTVRSFFTALNDYDKDAVGNLLAPDGGEWYATLAICETMKMQISVIEVGTPQINGNRCTVSVTTSSTAPGVSMNEPTDTRDMYLAKVSGRWLVTVED
jgi:hypothetical protein